MPFIGVISLIASIISLGVAYRALLLQKKADKDLEKMDDSIKGISNTQENLKSDVKKTEDNTKIIKQAAEQMKKHIDESMALNKYQHLDDKDLKKRLNESYQQFIHFIFDDNIENFNICILTKNKLNEEKKFEYSIEVVKDKDITNVPKTKSALWFKLYIIKIISPRYPSSLTEEQLNEYKYSPIKEGEYYGCRFDTEKCSWILGQRLTLGRDHREGFYPFYLTDYVYETEEISSANQLMGHTSIFPTPPNTQPTKDTDLKYITGFEIENYLIQLIRKDNQIFFKIFDSPPKKICLIDNFKNDDIFLVFEDLRGHIKSEAFINTLKDIILKTVKEQSITMDIESSDEETHHIKVSLTPEEEKILTSNRQN